MGPARLVVVVLSAFSLSLVGGCIATSSVQCEDGRVCPSGTTCEDTHHLCVVPDQLSVCASLTDHAACSFAQQAGTCIDGLCLPTVCGDGVIEGSEQCEGSDLQGVGGCLDLGYYEDGPVTCTTSCQYDRSKCAGICGDGIVDPAHEACDAMHATVVAQCNDPAVGFYNPGEVHCNAACEFDTSECTGSCGDGVINGSEVCDGSPPAVGCLGYGFDYGAIGCVRCGPNFASCGAIGWRDEQFQLGAPTSTIMATSPSDYWIGGTSNAAHVVNHIPHEYSFSDGTGSTLWLQGNEVFLGGSTNAVQHGVVTNGDITFSPQALPGTASRFVQRLWAVGTNDLYGAGVLAGTGIEIYHYNGTSWSVAMAGPTNAVIDAFWVASANDMWLSTELTGVGTLWHWTGSWAQVTMPASITASSHASAIWGADATHVYIGGDSGFGMWNGSTLSPVLTGIPAVNAIHGASATDVVVAGSQSAFRYDGATWNDVSGTEIIRALWDQGNVVFGTLNVSATYLAGSAWASVTGPNDGALRAWGSAGTVFAISGESLFERNVTGAWDDLIDLPDNGVDIFGFATNDYWYATTTTVQHYDGAWHDETANLGALGIAELDGIQSLWGASSTDMWVCDLDAFYHWTGASWTRIASPSNSTTTDLYGSASNDIWATTGTSTILHYNGATWTPMTVAGTQLTSVFALSSSLVFATGDTGQMATWNGQQWTVQQLATEHNMTAVWAAAADDAFATDDDGGYWHFDGSIWAPIRPVGQLAESHGLWGDADHVYFIGEDGVLPLYRNTPW